MPTLQREGHIGVDCPTNPNRRPILERHTCPHCRQPFYGAMSRQNDVKHTQPPRQGNCPPRQDDCPPCRDDRPPRWDDRLLKTD